MERSPYNIPDVYREDAPPNPGAREYDKIIGYQTVSVLAVPMANDRDEVIGVMQLLNALDEDGGVIPFHREHEYPVRSLASQAAIRLTSRSHAAETSSLLDAFVRVMSTAIDERSPFNSSHTRSMVRLADSFVDWLRASGNSWSFTNQEKRQLLMSVWLHDIGKLVIPLEVMNKGTRLGERLPLILHRIELARLQLKTDVLEGEISEEQYAEAAGILREAEEVINTANSVSVLPDSLLPRITAIGGLLCRIRGREQPLLTAEELSMLRIPHGTLLPHERKVIENHVTMTKRMLEQMPFSRGYREVPGWAGSHHEMLDGSGYPDHLSGDQIPREVRLLTILDIFDALTSSDRPYRASMSYEKALAVLYGMADEGKLDAYIISLFEQSKVWRGGSYKG
jgi:HD-GYP domain-containing protein (c-di-GMP phosphodiesterase class II)